jgi:hypothetical protein
MQRLKFFSFVAETPTNENPQPLRGSILVLNIKAGNINGNMFFTVECLY